MLLPYKQVEIDSTSMMSTQWQEVESQLEEKKKDIEEFVFLPAIYLITKSCLLLTGYVPSNSLRNKQLMEEREKNKRKEESVVVKAKVTDDKENEDSLSVKVEDVQAKAKTAPTVSLAEWRPTVTLLPVVDFC
eukprot:scaffold2036_cov51-Attheya_sp.AAC.3